MKKIDRLLMDAKRLSANKGLDLFAAMIEITGEAWRATAHLWDRARGHTVHETTLHDTVEDAVRHIKILSAKHPSREEVVVIIDDL